MFSIRNKYKTVFLCFFFLFQNLQGNISENKTGLFLYKNIVLIIPDPNKLTIFWKSPCPGILLVAPPFLFQTSKHPPHLLLCAFEYNYGIKNMNHFLPRYLHIIYLPLAITTTEMYTETILWCDHLPPNVMRRQIPILLRSSWRYLI